MKTILLMTYGISIIALNITFGQWVQTGNSYHTIHTLASNGSYLYAGIEGGGIYVTSNNGENWVEINNGLTSTNAKYVFDIAIKSNNANDTILFAGTNAGVFISTNSGLDWTESNSGLTNTNVRGFAFDSSNIFAATLGGVFRSTNIGTTWSAVNSGLTNFSVLDIKIVDDYLFAATYGSGVFRSSNLGSSWIQVSSGLGGLSVYTLFGSGSNLFAGTEEVLGTFISTNYGATWSAVNTGLTNHLSFDFTEVQNNQSSSYLFAATFAGVFLSINDGMDWIEVNSGLSGIRLRIFAIEVCGTELFAGTYGAGVMRRPLSEMIPTNIENISDDLADDFLIYQNFPNPFNSITKIKYSIPNSDLVQIKLFDIMGREINTLLNEFKQAGSYEVEFNASELASGVYFYRMIGGDYSETKKMILLR